jgi:PEP-CTERM motif
MDSTKLWATPVALLGCLVLISTCTLNADTFNFTTAGTIGANDETVGAANSALSTGNTPIGYPSLTPVATDVSDTGGIGLCSPSCSFSLTSGLLQLPLINGGANYQNASAPYDYQIPYDATAGSFTLKNGSGIVFSGTFVPSSLVFDVHNGAGGLVGDLTNTNLVEPVYVTGTFGPGAGALDGDTADPTTSSLELSLSSFNVFSWSAGYPGGGSAATYQAVISDATSGSLESELVLIPESSPAAVPEPSSVVLLSLVLAGLGFLHRKARKN